MCVRGKQGGSEGGCIWGSGFRPCAAEPQEQVFSWRRQQLMADDKLSCCLVRLVMKMIIMKLTHLKKKKTIL